jgi:hypothetical protein
MRNDSPRLFKAGWPRQQRKAAKHHLKERTGRLLTPRETIDGIFQPPVCAESGKLLFSSQRALFRRSHQTASQRCSIDRSAANVD